MTLREIKQAIKSEFPSHIIDGLQIAHEQHTYLCPKCDEYVIRVPKKDKDNWYFVRHSGMGNETHAYDCGTDYWFARHLYSR